MLIRPRVIPVLQLEDDSLVKTMKFKNPNYLGDPINATRIFNEKYVDELCIVDITKSRKKGVINYDLLNSIASEAFMPLSYGGGITTFSDASKIFKLGFEKIVISSAAYGETNFIEQIVKVYGSQSVIISVDYKVSKFGKVNCYSNGGTKKEKIDIDDHIKNIVGLGAGEVILQSIDRDGTYKGYDLELIKKISSRLDIPLIALGGASSINDLSLALNYSGASAVAAGSMFVYFGKKKAVLINVPTENELIDEGVYYER